MGKSSKKSDTKVAVATPVTDVKASKKGAKRDAGDALEKLASAKKQKKEVEVKKKVPPPKKEESSSSEEEDSSSEDEKPAVSKKVPAAALKKSDSSDESSESESDSSEDDKAPASTGAGKPVAKAVKKESSSDEDEDDSSDDEPPKAQKNIATKATPKPKVQESSDESEEEPQKKKVKVQSNKDSSSDEEDGSEDSEDSSEESEDEKPAKTPKKDSDVKMKDAPSSGFEKKEPKTPQNQASGSKTLFVGNLSFNAERGDIEEFFGQAGEVVSVRLATSEDGSFRGFGHVEFATEADAQKALKMNGQDLLGRAVKLDLARERGTYTPQSGSTFKKGGQGQSQTIFVKGFDKSLGEDGVRSALQEHFGSCGQISRLSIPPDFETGAPKGMAYIDFKDQDAISQALELNGSDLGGYTLTVDEAKPRGESRDGGGWSGGRSGGRGDSGGRGGRFGGRRGGRDGGGRGGRGRGGGGRGGRGTPNRQSYSAASTGKKTTFGDD
ncbi:uncharacterized protein A4U43_C07F34380 [Asparagus officinalis]|uniref:RRM domain-containing protein n=1 Tax=Asparagus officinalis TaxID=4686 RepID=A0A5P1EIZ6_ASPOF|nr:uncharacterized protein A4U43_C07F34380 [Asparagus officinalis]